MFGEQNGHTLRKSMKSIKHVRASYNDVDHSSMTQRADVWNGYPLSSGGSNCVPKTSTRVLRIRVRGLQIIVGCAAAQAEHRSLSASSPETCTAHIIRSSRGLYVASERAEEEYEHTRSEKAQYRRAPDCP